MRKIACKCVIAHTFSVCLVQFYVQYGVNDSLKPSTLEEQITGFRYSPSSGHQVVYYRLGHITVLLSQVCDACRHLSALR